MKTRIIFNGIGNQAETFSTSAFDDGGEQQAVQKAPQRIGVTKFEKSRDVRILLHLFCKLDASFGHVAIDLLEMFQFLNTGLDQLGYDLNPVGVLSHEAHRHGGGLALAVRMVLKKGRKVCHHSGNPFRAAGGG